MTTSQGYSPYRWASSDPSCSASSHLLGARGLVVGQRLLGVLPLLRDRMPAHQPDLADQLLVLHQVLDDVLGLLGALLVPGVDEDEAAVAGDDHAAAEQLARLVVELELVEPVAQRVAVLLLVERDLDAPLVAAAALDRSSRSQRPTLLRSRPGRG